MLLSILYFNAFIALGRLGLSRGFCFASFLFLVSSCLACVCVLQGCSKGSLTSIDHVVSGK